MISLRFLPLVSLTGLIVLAAVVLGQETDVTNISAGFTPTPASIPTGTNSGSTQTFPPGFPTPSITTGVVSPDVVQCYIPEVIAQISENLPIEENTSNLVALPTGIKCYRILSGGILEGTPYTTIGILGVTDISRTTDTSSSAPTGGALSSSSSDGSSDNNLKVVLPAVLGSVFVSCLLVVALLWVRRNRNRTATRRQSMRAWVQRPGGWVGDRKEEQTEIALHERQPSHV